ncbi:hypothetical protein ACTPEF_24565 [Clostridioides difficile]
MLLEKLRKEVLQASLDLLNYNLVTLTGGNVSGRDGIFAASIHAFVKAFVCTDGRLVLSVVNP